MKYISCFLLLSGCANLQKSTVLVHDYVFREAEKACSNHEGLHYVYASVEMKMNKSEDYPCTEVHKFRCQDETLINFETGIEFCFISEMQRQETEEAQ